MKTADFTYQADDGASLHVSGWAVDAPKAVVQVIHGMLRANVIRGLLESAGIPVMLRYEAAGPAIGLITAGLMSLAFQGFKGLT